MPPVGPQASSSLQTELYPANAVAVTLAADFNVAAAFTTGYARELYVGGAGTVIAQLFGDAAPQTYAGVPAGTILRGLWTLVKSTTNGTTATNIVARY